MPDLEKGVCELLIPKVCVCVCAHVCACSVISVMSDSLRPSGSSVHGILQAGILEWAKENRNKEENSSISLANSALSPILHAGCPWFAKETLACIRFYIMASVLHTYGMCFICSCRRRITVNTRQP